MPASASQVCLTVSQCVISINQSNISIAPVCPNEAMDLALLGYQAGHKQSKSG